jgi:hypothetical protein
MQQAPCTVFQLLLVFTMTRSGGAVLLDVRLVNKYDASHAAGSLSAPLYNPIQKWDLPSIIRRAGFAFFGIYGTGGGGVDAACCLMMVLCWISLLSIAVMCVGALTAGMRHAACKSSCWHSVLMR